PGVLGEPDLLALPGDVGVGHHDLLALGGEPGLDIRVVQARDHRSGLHLRPLAEGDLEHAARDLAADDPFLALDETGEVLGAAAAREPPHGKRHADRDHEADENDPALHLITFLRTRPAARRAGGPSGAADRRAGPAPRRAPWRASRAALQAASP